MGNVIDFSIASMEDVELIRNIGTVKLVKAPPANAAQISIDLVSRPLLVPLAALPVEWSSASNILKEVFNHSSDVEAVSVGGATLLPQFWGPAIIPALHGQTLSVTFANGDEVPGTYKIYAHIMSTPFKKTKFPRLLCSVYPTTPVQELAKSIVREVDKLVVLEIGSGVYSAEAVHAVHPVAPEDAVLTMWPGRLDIIDEEAGMIPVKGDIEKTEKRMILTHTGELGIWKDHVLCVSITEP